MRIRFTAGRVARVRVVGDVLVALLTVIGVGVVVFATTNIDDILLLAVFFADGALRPRAVVVGQFVGIGLLTAVSAVAAFTALAIPEGWIGLLGLAPLGLGIRGLYSLWRSRDAGESEEADRPQAGETRAGRAIYSQSIAVALVTVANGGDNLGVYIPLFSREFSWVPVYTGVFAVMTALSCAAGYWLVRHPLLGARIRRYGHAALPPVLIGLGLHILSDARALLP
jgi:cadmium resistance protein CadD (predicted permease)